MPKKIYETKGPSLLIGDIVYHVLYGREWLGILLRILGQDTEHSISLVSMLPGTKHEKHFEKALTKYRISDNMGYVSERWLERYFVEKKP